MKFRRKPVTVEAEQFFPEKKPWPRGIQIRLPHWANKSLNPQPTYGFLADGYTAKVEPGDWVVTNQTGERYMVRQALFSQTYEYLD